MGVWAFNRFAKTDDNFDQKLSEFRERAEEDINNDDVKSFSFGLQLPPKTELEATQHIKIDSIKKQYGITSKNLGCTISDEMIAAANLYKKITSEYLKKRNGNNWEAKMDKEIAKIRAVYK